MHRTPRLVLAGVAAAALVAALATAAFLRIPTHSAHAAPAASSGQTVCIGHHPQPSIWYTAGCTGHDEPELDPVSNHPGSGKNITWTFVLPTNGAINVDAVGPTFWFGGSVSDSKSYLGQAFLELQFYPNSFVSKCTANGGYSVAYAPNTYTACSPVWKVSLNGKSETAAFNAMLTDSKIGGPLVMHAGDVITDHQYVTKAADGMHITITDLTTGHSGTIILDSSKDGPLMPAYDKQIVGNALKWGLVDDTPNAFVWEIGHTGNFTKPAGQFCLPGSATNPPCYSYNVPTWLQFKPLRILSVTFGDGSGPQSWAAVSDFGGKAEIDQYCGAANYGTPFCWYPWFTQNRGGFFTYGGDYPRTKNDFGQVDQFTQTTTCPSPFGPNTDYCDTTLK